MLLQIHEEALELVSRYKKCEAELIAILQRINRHKVYQRLKCRSLFEYTVRILKLSESVAYNFIVVARKAEEVPQLMTALSTGQLTVAKARKITPVLNKANHREWLDKAEHLPARKLELEVATANPRAAIVESAKFVSADRVNLQIGVSAITMNKLRQVQNLLSQRARRALSLEETLEVVLDLCLEAKDPLRKAERLSHRKKQPLARQVDLRDQRQCTFQDENGQRCEERRWLDVHHVVPRSKGGEDTLENLTTLCSGHHRLVHSH